MRKEIIPLSDRTIYEGRNIRVEIIGIDAWVTPRIHRIRRRGKKHFITKARPIPMMPREEFINKFGVMQPNWEYGLPIEQKELLKEALEILPMTGR